MGQPYDELLYSLIISQLKDDGFYEEADSLQRKVVNAVFNIEASRQLRKIVEIMSVTNGMSWRKLTTNSQCPQGVILNLKSGSESPSSSSRDITEGAEDPSNNNNTRQPLEPRVQQPSSSGLNTAELRIGEVRDQPARIQPDSTPTNEEEGVKEEENDEQRWKKDMEHMRFDFKLSRKVDFKIHNFDPTKKRNVVEDKNLPKRVKGSSSAQGKFYHLKMNKDFLPDDKKGQTVRLQNLTQVVPAQPSRVPGDDGTDPGKGNLQDFLQKITIPMDKLN